MNPANRRTLHSGAIGVALAAAAVAAHSLAVDKVRAGLLTTLGAASEVILVVLFGFLVLLACRYLVMLGLAAYDYWMQASCPPACAGPAPFVSIIVPAFNEAPMIRN